MDPIYRALYGDFFSSAGNLIDSRYEITGWWKYFEFPSLTEGIEHEYLIGDQSVKQHTRVDLAPFRNPNLDK